MCALRFDNCGFWGIQRDSFNCSRDWAEKSRAGGAIFCFLMPSSSPRPVLPTTVLFFDHTAKMGGGEIALLNLVTHLDRRRYDPVVVLAMDGPFREKLAASGVETHVLPLSRGVGEVRKDSLGTARAVSLRMLWEIARYAYHLRGFARARGAAILHTNSLKADIIGALGGRIGGIPTIWHVRDRIEDDYLPSAATQVFRALCRFLPDYIVVNSASTLESLHLPPRNLAKARKNGLIHDGMPPLEADFWQGNPLFDASCSAKHPCIGLVGRISPWKGQDVFLRAAALVIEEYPDICFQIIGAPLFGEEDFERELHALSAALGLENHVQWLGFRSDVFPLVSRLTLLVHASKSGEPFGQVVVEAMMVAKPVIATRGGGIPEIVVDGETGLLVPMGDAPALARAMICLLENPERAQQMGLAGQKRAAEHFTIHHTVAKVSNLYEDVIRDQKQRKTRFWRVLGAIFVGLGLWRLARRGLESRL